MGVVCFVVLCVIVGASANGHPPANPPYLLEEVKATAESRVLERVEVLLQALDAKIKVLDDNSEKIKRDIRSLFLVQDIMVKSTNKSLSIVSEQFRSFSTSATQRMTNLENKLERLQEDKVADRVDELKRDISSLLILHNKTNEMIKTTNESITQRMINQEQKLESISNIIRGTNDMIKTTNESLTQQQNSLKKKLEPTLPDTDVYLIQPDPTSNIKFQVFRDWKSFGGGWIVFQRRIDGSVDFYRNWTEYKNGFGDLRGEHWLGLDNLHLIVKARRNELLIVLEDFDGVTKYAKYDDFKIGDESEMYVLKSLGNYTGTAGDSFSIHKGSKFSTYDQDNDQRDDNCSKKYKGAWWFNPEGYCYDSHLNGPYLKERNNIFLSDGFYWFGFLDYPLKSSKMMVRPKYEQNAKTK